jgi:hypothetical protein
MLIPKILFVGSPPVFPEIKGETKIAIFSKLLTKAGASNLRPRNIFVRPKLDPEFKEKSEF